MKFTVLFLTFFAALSMAQSPAGDAARGKDLFGKKYMCYTCHGWDGHGGSGATLSGMKLNQAGFTAYVRKGGAGAVGVAGRMPAYSAKTVPDQDLADIYAFIRTMPESKSAKDIPALSNILGQN
jgi:mono/diheme cytochrome c family protein